MQHRWAVIAGLGILLAGAGAWAQDAPTAPGVVVLGERGAQPAPTVLRGTPATVRPAAVVADSGQRFQIVAGRRLWLVDQAGGEVRSCINRNTSTVGLRVVSCISTELGRFHRTFGPAFQP
jgi:hypothetical protein